MSVFYCKWCEIFHEVWMFCDSEFCHDAKKWAIADVLSGKNIFSTVNHSYNKLWKCHGILFDTIKMFMFFLYRVCSLAGVSWLSLENFYVCLFLFMVGILQHSNKWSHINHLVRNQISVHKNFIFYRSNSSVVPNKQPRDWKIDRLFVTSRIKFVIAIFVILSGY